MNKILLVEDDSSLRESITKILTAEGYQVRASCNCAEATKELKNTDLELIILDWMLPDGQGIDVLRAYRSRGGKAPVIFLTARAETLDKVLGLETGADDYVTKPFEPRELIARVRARMRAGSSAPVEQDTIIARPIRIEIAARKVIFNKEEITLSRMEFDLLKILCENPGKVFTREELLNKVWGYERFPTTRTVDTHILQLRNKFGEHLFETIRGVGYRFKI